MFMNELTSFTCVVCFYLSSHHLWYMLTVNDIAEIFKETRLNAIIFNEYKSYK